MIPNRMSAELKRLQQRSEWWVAGLQLIVIGIFSFIYSITPVGHVEDAPISSIPLGLSLYSIIVLVRLWFAATGQLSSPILAISVLSEVTILLGMIWTYHLQYETDPAVNLKNSHLLYVFILIALRALRFEPVWVVLTGISAAIGWCAMVVHVLYKQGSNILTWDYLTYASTPRLHLGAESDKILAIFMVTFIISLVVWRARFALTRSVEQGYAAHDLSRFFDANIAQRIQTAGENLSPGQGELRHSAIMMIDLRGFTKASRDLTPTQLIRLLGHYQRLVVPIIQQHNGIIDKFMGDGILASFGTETIQNTHYARDAIDALKTILAAIPKWQESIPIALDIGAAIATGNVVLGVIGHDSRLEYTVIGEAVNNAAKLEKYNKSLNSTAIITRETYELAYQQGYNTNQEKDLFHYHPHCQIDGMSDPIDLYTLQIKRSG